MATSQSYMLQSFARSWWVLLLWGLTFLVAGLCLLFWPVRTAAVLVAIVAAFVLIAGIIGAISAVVDRDSGWGWRLAGGILGILVGIILLANPVAGALIVVAIQFYLLALGLIVMGIVTMVGGKYTADSIGYQWSWGNFFLGVLEILLGIFLLFRPLLGIFTLLWLVAIVAIVGGVLLIIQSFRVKSLAEVAV
jgi:uncharacterized membrane protein HdeD (DUF308 family)